jgi:hypothetical protein
MAESNQIDIEFIPSGRGKARCPPNPDFPDGVDIDGTGGALPACSTALPYPAPECGQWLLHCRRCAITILITAAGRPDDPRSVRLLCRKGAN